MNPTKLDPKKNYTNIHTEKVSDATLFTVCIMGDDVMFHPARHVSLKFYYNNDLGSYGWDYTLDRVERVEYLNYIYKRLKAYEKSLNTFLESTGHRPTCGQRVALFGKAFNLNELNFKGLWKKADGIRAIDTYIEELSK